MAHPHPCARFEIVLDRVTVKSLCHAAQVWPFLVYSPHKNSKGIVIASWLERAHGLEVPNLLFLGRFSLLCEHSACDLELLTDFFNL